MNSVSPVFSCFIIDAFLEHNVISSFHSGHLPGKVWEFESGRGKVIYSDSVQFKMQKNVNTRVVM